jgi:hypothetical protein
MLMNMLERSSGAASYPLSNLVQAQALLYIEFNDVCVFHVSHGCVSSPVFAFLYWFAILYANAYSLEDVLSFLLMPWDRLEFSYAYTSLSG